MRLLLFCFISILFLAPSKAQKDYAKPDFAVQYVSYFGIGSESVQKPAVIGYNAANYALMQQALPQWTEQGLGVPVYFYKNMLESCGADKLIDALIKDYDKINIKNLEPRLLAIRNKIKTATISKNLQNQLRNAINEFYKGKKIRLSSSSNFQFEEGQTTFSVICSMDNLGENLAEVYASFWEEAAVIARFSNKKLSQNQLALGILVTQGFEYGYAIGRVQTDYSSKEPSIKIMSKRESSTERIGFSQFDSKWYKTYEKAKEAAVFVDNAALTPTVRELQNITKLLDPILRRDITKTSSWSQEDSKAVFTFIIKKTEEGKFFVKLQQPELQLQSKK